MAADGRRTVRGDELPLIPVTDPQGPLQDALDLRREAALPMIANQDATAAQQMGEQV